MKKESEALRGIRVFTSANFKRDIDPMLLSSLPNDQQVASYNEATKQMLFDQKIENLNLSAQQRLE